MTSHIEGKVFDPPAELRPPEPFDVWTVYGWYAGPNTSLDYGRWEAMQTFPSRAEAEDNVKNSPDVAVYRHTKIVHACEARKRFDWVTAVIVLCLGFMVAALVTAWMT